MAESVFKDYIYLSVGLLMSGLVLTSATMSIGLSKQFNEKQVYAQVMAEHMEQKKRNLYYETNPYVYYTDVMTLCMKHKGQRAVVVKYPNGDVLTWDKTSESTPYSIREISEKLRSDGLYESKLEYDANQTEVMRYVFTFIPSTAGGEDGDP